MSLKLALFAAAVTGALAQTSLYIPDTDPQPLSADVLGVGPNGETTYLLHPGVQSTFADDDVGLPGPATLIEGPTEVKLIYNDPSGMLDLNADCTLSGDNNADCVAVVVEAGVTTTMTMAETVSPFEVQGGSTIAGGAAAPTPASGASGVSAPTGAPSGSSSAGSNAPSQSGSSTSGTGAPAPTQSDNGVGRVHAGAAAGFVAAAGVALSVLL